MPGYQYRGGQPDPHRPKTAPPSQAQIKPGTREWFEANEDVIVPENPPKHVARRQVGSWYDATANRLRKNPGQWFRVRLVEKNPKTKNHPVYSIGHQLKKRGLKVANVRSTANPDWFAIYAMHPAEDEA